MSAAATNPHTAAGRSRALADDENLVGPLGLLDDLFLFVASLLVSRRSMP
jgi:hypothetical protein